MCLLLPLNFLVAAKLGWSIILKLISDGEKVKYQFAHTYKMLHTLVKTPKFYKVNMVLYYFNNLNCPFDSYYYL